MRYLKRQLLSQYHNPKVLNLDLKYCIYFNQEMYFDWK